MSSMRLHRLIGSTVSVVVMAAMVGVAPAGAVLAPGYGPVGTGFNPGFGGDPGQVAVDDATGDILTADPVNNRVLVLAPDTSPGGTATTLTEFPAVAPFGVAVDQTSHAVYVSEDAPSNRVERFVSDGAPVPTYTFDPSFVAVPLTSGAVTVPIAVDPTTHDLLVADGNEIKRFTATGALVRTIDGADTPTGKFRNVLDVKAGGAATYVVDYRGLPGALIDGDGKTRIEQFDSQGAWVRTIAAVDAPAIAAVDPARDRLVAVGRTGQSQNGSQLSTFEAGAITGVTNATPPGGAFLSGVGVDGGATHRAYMTASSLSVGKGIFAFIPAPGAHADSFTTTDPHVAHLTGAVNPEGKATTAHIEYCSRRDPCGTDPTIAWTALPDTNIGGGTADVPLAGEITDLLPHTGYLVRIVATDTETSTYSNTATVTTADAPPLATTGSTTDVSSTTATVTGTVTPLGVQSAYYFEYGETTSYGHRLPAAGAEGVAGNGFSARSVNWHLAGLKPATAYHYRIVAKNSAGTTTGADQVLTTDPANTDGTVRAYEMVSPVGKEGIAVDSAFAGARTSDDGNAFVYGTAKSSFPGAQGAPFVPRVLGLRSMKDWASTPLELPLENLSAGNILFFAVIAVSSDVRKALVLSTQKLTDQATQGQWNLYIRQTGATPEYTYVATDQRLGALSSETGAFSIVGTSDDLTTTAFVLGGDLLKATVGQGVSVISIPPSLVHYQPDGTPATFNAGINGSFTDAHPVSADGSRIYFSPTGGPLYLQEHETVTALSVSQRPGASTSAVRATFIAASPDGRYVEFTTTCPECSTIDGLTPSAPDGAGFYRYDTATGDLTYLAPDQDAAIKVPRPTQNAVLYFTVATQTLSYSDGGTVKTVAVLDDVPAADDHASVVRGSDNGRFYVFGAVTKLTSYDNSGHLEFYRYDAQTDSLVCVTCRTDGGPATGRVQLGISDTNDSGFNDYKPRAVLDDGTVFFDTTDPLVGTDTNGTRDVYQYRDGRATLISRGKLAANSQFDDATPDGSSVFFTTDDQLVGQDKDSIVDLYVARVGGGLAGQNPPPRPSPCAAPECREATSGPTGSDHEPSEGAAGTQGRPATAARAKITVLGSTVSGTALRVTVQVSGHGVIRASGIRIQTTVRTAAKAGRYVLKIALSRKTRADLRRHRRIKLTAKFSLTPPFATATSAKLSRMLGK
jgi:hypothetical protein